MLLTEEIRLTGCDAGCAIKTMGQLENSVIVDGYNTLPYYELDDPNEPGAAWITEPNYCPLNANGSMGDRRLEQYGQFQAAQSGQEGICRWAMGRYNAKTKQIEAAVLSAGVGGQVELSHNDGKPGGPATGMPILTARADGVRVTGRLEVNGAPVLVALDLDAGGALIVQAGRARFRIAAEALPPLP